ncbi:hypothetical protein NpNSSI1_00011703 [Neofusicoccum parvum]|nr:hypothetical protein NpNSSI1_00011703 [Neofusicoccum parvum]
MDLFPMVTFTATSKTWIYLYLWALYFLFPNKTSFFGLGLHRSQPHQVAPAEKKEPPGSEDHDEVLHAINTAERDRLRDAADGARAIALIRQYIALVNQVTARNAHEYFHDMHDDYEQCLRRLHEVEVALVQLQAMANQHNSLPRKFGNLAHEEQATVDSVRKSLPEMHAYVDELRDAMEELMVDNEEAQREARETLEEAVAAGVTARKAQEQYEKALKTGKAPEESGSFGNGGNCK